MRERKIDEDERKKTRQRRTKIKREKSPNFACFWIYYLKCARLCMWYISIKRGTRGRTCHCFKNNNTNENNRECSIDTSVRVSCCCVRRKEEKEKIDQRTLVLASLSKNKYMYIYISKERMKKKVTLILPVTQCRCREKRRRRREKKNTMNEWSTMLSMNDHCRLMANSDDRNYKLLLNEH